MQAHASAAIVNFTEGCESDLLPNYLDQLIQKLLQLAGKGAKTVKVRAGAKGMSCTRFGLQLVAAGWLEHKTVKAGRCDTQLSCHTAPHVERLLLQSGSVPLAVCCSLQLRSFAGVICAVRCLLPVLPASACDDALCQTWLIARGSTTSAEGIARCNSICGQAC